jgi:hypothetical protein
VLTYGVTCMLEALEQLESEGWTASDATSGDVGSES